MAPLAPDARAGAPCGARLTRNGSLVPRGHGRLTVEIPSPRGNHSGAPRRHTGSTSPAAPSPFSRSHVPAVRAPRRSPRPPRRRRLRGPDGGGAIACRAGRCRADAGPADADAGSHERRADAAADRAHIDLVADAGQVDGSGDGPQLSVEFPGDRLVDVTLEDAEARAWRVVVAGTGALAEDRFEIVVEAGDVGPVITATEIRGGEAVEQIDLSFYGEDTAAAGGCHRTLDVWVDSSSFTFADDGTGRLRTRLNMPDPSSGVLTITGGTAGWPGEPFVLGPWSATEAFAWGG